MVLPYVTHLRTVCHPLEDTPWWNNLPQFLLGAAGLLGDVGGFLPVLSCRRPSSHSHCPHQQVLLLCPQEVLRHTVQQAPWVSDRAFDRVVQQVSTSCGRFQAACALEASRRLRLRLRLQEQPRAPPRGRLNQGRALTDWHSPAIK
jgi:hypothetical protein